MLNVPHSTTTDKFVQLVLTTTLPEVQNAFDLNIEF